MDIRPFVYFQYTKDFISISTYFYESSRYLFIDYYQDMYSDGDVIDNDEDF